MNRREFLFGVVGGAVCLGGLDVGGEPAIAPGLKDLGGCRGRLIGAVVDAWQLEDRLWRPLILKNFNLITLGRLKWGFSRPSVTAYDFEETDRVVRFCVANGLAMHGHNLCWNASNPAWLAKMLTPANAERILVDNITTTMKRYAGKISSYDVVNEPIASWLGRSDGLYTGPWLDALGPRYIDVAFHAAKAADPSALRVLNVAHVEQGGRGDDRARELTLRLIEALLGRGVPVQAIGLESHLAGDVSGRATASRDLFVARVRQFGLQSVITELDVDDTRLSVDREQNDRDVARVYGEYLQGLLVQAQPSRVIFFSPGDRKNWYDRLAPSAAYARRGGALHRPGLFDQQLMPKAGVYRGGGCVAGSVLMSWPVGRPLCDVSVVIPTRGRPALLRRAVESVLRQTHENFEVIVVIDGDDPATEADLRAMEDVRIHVLALAASVGGSEARNRGALAGTGRYIALLDDDDEWLPKKLEKQLALADAASGKNFVVVTQYLFRVEGGRDEVWPGHLPGAGEALSEFLFSSRGGFQTSTYLCPRELFLRTQFTPGLKKHQDWDWFLRLSVLPGFELLVVAEPLSIYWVPLKKRGNVSGVMDWKFSQAWARGKLPLMTRKAYATFLVKICVRGAGMQGEGLRAAWPLLREVLMRGRPSPWILCEFAVSALLPESVRTRLRAGIFWGRRVMFSDSSVAAVAAVRKVAANL